MLWECMPAKSSQAHHRGSNVLHTSHQRCWSPPTQFALIDDGASTLLDHVMSSMCTLRPDAWWTVWCWRLATARLDIFRLTSSLGQTRRRRQRSELPVTRTGWILFEVDLSPIITSALGLVGWFFYQTVKSMFSSKFFSKFPITSNFWTHAWSIKCSLKNNQLHSLVVNDEMNILSLISL